MYSLCKEIYPHAAPQCQTGDGRHRVNMTLSNMMEIIFIPKDILNMILMHEDVNLAGMKGLV